MAVDDVIIVFRAIDISLQRIRFYQRQMPRIKIEHAKWKYGQGQILLIDLVSEATCTTLADVLTTHPLTVSWGVWISISTKWDHRGLTVPPYVCDFMRTVGGTLDFSFVSCGCRNMEKIGKEFLK